MLSLIHQGFDPDGAKIQLENLPTVAGVSADVVHKLAKRSLTTAFKRRGTIIVSREQLGLPPIESLFE